MTTKSKVKVKGKITKRIKRTKRTKQPSQRTRRQRATQLIRRGKLPSKVEQTKFVQTGEMGPLLKKEIRAIAESAKYFGKGSCGQAQSDSPVGILLRIRKAKPLTRQQRRQIRCTVFTGQVWCKNHDKKYKKAISDMSKWLDVIRYDFLHGAQREFEVYRALSKADHALTATQRSKFRRKLLTMKRFERLHKEAVSSLE